MQAKDIMRKNVVTVTPRMTLRQVTDLFVSRRITGAPVVDSKGRPIGVVSQTDLVRDQRTENRRKEDKTGPRAEFPSYHLHDDMMPDLNTAFTMVEPEKLVQDVMNPAALSADERTPVEDLAMVMLGKHIHRILITSGGKLTGIVTSMDMLRALVPTKTRHAHASREDNA